MTTNSDNKKPVNKKVMVHAYKMNGWLYRVVEYPTIIAYSQDIILLHLKTKDVITITSSENSKKNTFYKNNYNKFWLFIRGAFFNVIINVFDHDWSFYINVSSPFLMEEGAIKYIDLDIDIKVNSANQYRIIDQDEYLMNKIKWSYPQKLQDCVQRTKTTLVNLIKKGAFNNFFKDNERYFKQKEDN